MKNEELRNKSLKALVESGTIASAICETSSNAARVICSTITTVKLPTTKCPTAKRNTSYSSNQELFQLFQPFKTVIIVVSF